MQQRCYARDTMSDFEEYRTLLAHEPADLDRKVNLSLAEGFELYGNPYAVMHAGNGTIHRFQAMVKRRKVPVGKSSV
jgi:hypothetical protein